MAEILYTANQDSPENIEGFEQYSQEDRDLINSFQINSTFDPTKNYSELHVLSLSDEVLESYYNYTDFTLLGNAQSAGQDGASVLTIDPIQDAVKRGYINGGVKLLYHFLDDLYTIDLTKVNFYIQDISTDRTELSLSTLNLSQEDVVALTSTIKSNLTSQSYFTGFRLNFGSNDLFIATNIDTLDSPTGKVVVVKLYEPLPNTYKVKSALSIVNIVSDSIAYEVDSEYITPIMEPPTLRSPNFNIEVTDHTVIPTGYFSYDDLFSYPINNSNNEIYSVVNEKGININVDYSDFSNFIHFSSAQERLLNFKYKLDLIASYSASLATVSANTTTGSLGVSGSKDYYQTLMTGIVNNFDHYERYVYYESGSSSWPKSNTTKPYINKASNTPEAITWYTNELSNAISYDNTNYNSLAYSIPTFLRDDQNNQNYLTFVYMVGQHFDNLWLYSKAVTDKYDGDNRTDHGISKDLVGEALKNFGVKLYTSNKSVQDLFSTFIGQAYQSGSEQITNYITGSLTGSNTPIQPTSYDDYNKEVQKRIYHNLPLLLKSKGTERGLRALINCFGIQQDILDIKLYGGRNNTERPFFGDYQFYTSSLDKIRLDNTGSIVSGSTLSSNTSIIKRDDKYTDDLHAVEVGFSHVDNIDTYIRANITGSFDIDDYIGDPQSQYENTYSGLSAVANTLLSGSLGTSGSYDLRDYVRLIKFYDNTIFKMVKDFIPARVSADTGIIIRPNLLNRSKAKSVITSGSRPEYTGSIDTAFVAGGNAGIFNGTQNGTLIDYDTAYTDQIQTPTGPVGNSTLHGQQQPRFNGEFQGSGVTVTNGNLTSNNTYLADSNISHSYQINFVTSSIEVCLLDPVSTIQYVISPTTQYYISDFFIQAGQCTFELTSPHVQPITFPITFGDPALGLQQYDTVTIHATNPNYIGICEDYKSITYGICNINTNNTAPTNVTKYQYGGVTNDVYNIENWFSTGPADTSTLEYTASWNDGTQHTVGIPRGTALGQSQQYYFDQAANTAVTITVKDPRLGEQCKLSNTVVINQTGLSALPTGSQWGTEFLYSTQSPFVAGTVFDPTDPNPANLPGGIDGNGNDIPGNTPAPDGNTYSCGVVSRYIGPPGSPYLSGTATLNYTLGVPGYFAPLNLPNNSVGIGPRTRYSAYELSCYNANDRNTTGWRGNWHITQVYQFDKVSPYSAYDSYTQWLDFDTTSPTSANSIKSFLIRGEKHYTQPGQTTPGNGPYQYFYDETSNAPYAITFPTDIYMDCICTIPGGGIAARAGANNVGSGANICQLSLRPTYSLIRAYVIRAYEEDSPLIFAQTTIYGKALSLATLSDGETLPLEGAMQYNHTQTNGTTSLGVGSLNAKFVNLWLLTNWDYSQGTPTGTYGQTNIYTAPTNTSQYPAPNVPGTEVGPWIQVPVRYFYNPDPTTASPYFPNELAAIRYVVGQQWEGTPPGF